MRTAGAGRGAAAAGAARGRLRPDARARRATAADRAGRLDRSGEVDAAQRARRHGAGARGRGPAHLVGGGGLRTRPTPTWARSGRRSPGWCATWPRRASAWSGQVFVDTPDLNSVARANADAALAVLDQVDAALVVFHRGSVAEARPTDALRPFARRRALLGVVNFADQLGAEARKTLKRAGGAGAAGRARAHRAATGLRGQRACGRGSASRSTTTGRRCSQSLRTLAEAGVATELRRRNAEALLGQIRSRVADALRTTEEAQGEVRKALEAGLAAVPDAAGRGLPGAARRRGRLPSPERAAPGGRAAHRAHRMGAPALRVGLGRARGRGAGLAGEPAGRAAGGGDGCGARRGAVTRTTGLGRAHGVPRRTGSSTASRGRRSPRQGRSRPSAGFRRRSPGCRTIRRGCPGSRRRVGSPGAR